MKRALWVAALLAAIWFAAALHWIIPDLVVPWDSKNQFYAFFRFLAGALHQGATPFWNPYHYAGHPSVADPQSLIFAPVFATWAWLDPAPSIRVFDLLVFGHLLVGGLGVAAIGLRERWPASACVLAGVVFMFGGAAGGRLQHTGMILSYALFPLALLLLQMAMQRRSFLLGIAFAAVAALLALGRNQVALLFCFVLVAFAVAEILRRQRPWLALRTRLPLLIVIGVVGLALIAVPMLLTLQFAALSNRPVETIAEALKGSLHPANLATLMIADIFGTHGAYWGPDGRTVPEVAWTDDSFNYMFVGAAPVVLLLWLGIVGGGAFKRGRKLITAIAAIALVYMLGRYTPVFGFLYDWVPGVAKFRRPVDANFVLTAMLALLSGHLLADYVREGLPAGRRVLKVVVVLGALAIVGWGLWFSYDVGHGAGALIGIAKALPAFVIVIGALMLGRTVRARGNDAVIVVAVAVAELLYWNVAFRLNAEPRTRYAVLEHPHPTDAQTLRLLEAELARRHAQGARPRVEFLGLGGPWQNIGLTRGIEAINGYNPLRIGAYDRQVAPGESNWLVQLRDFPETFPGYDSNLARALGLEYVLLGKPMPEVPNLKSQPDAEVLLSGPAHWLYRLRDPLPRVVLATGTARIAVWRPDRVEIEAETEPGGLLVLHDPYYPGWIAEVDGKRAPILRSGLFRSVEVPPGKHRVVFRFAPFSLENLAAAAARTLGRP